MNGESDVSDMKNIAARNTAEPGRRSEQLICGILETMRENPYAFRTCSDMACEARLSVSHFTRTFKLVVNESPREFLKAKKKQQAEELLKDPKLNIKEIAEKCGFQNQNHFSAWFKKRFKCSPSDFRARIERK